jgi:CheY-like chemotaxis protein
MAKRYAEKAGGKLQIESEVGAYTEVTLWLPAALGFAASEPSEHLPLARPTVTPRVLVVEDDDLVRETMLASMESARINSVEVRSGEDALALLKEGNMFDVLVADFSLPGINGAQMIRDAQQITPNLPALLITGNIGEVLFRGHETPRFGTLRKPFSPAQLIEAITALALREI